MFWEANIEHNAKIDGPWHWMVIKLCRNIEITLYNWNKKELETSEKIREVGVESKVRRRKKVNKMMACYLLRDPSKEKVYRNNLEFE